MTTSSAASVAGHPGEREKEKPAEKPAEKMEKRRALGRGLESLLPGPRVVAQPAELRSAGQPQAAVPPSLPGGAAGEHQVPHFVRNDKTFSTDRALSSDAAVFTGTIQAVAEDAVASAGAVLDSETAATGELRSPGQPRAAVPTYSSGEGITILAQAESRVPGNLVVNLAIADIDKNPFQTRYVGRDDALDELAESIKANGVLQPVVVRPAADDGRYILILGERRLHASKLAGRETIPAIVRRVSEQQAAEMTIIENLQRQDLSPLEQAEAFRVLSEEFKLTQSQIGERVGLSRESVANYMRLLRLPREVMQLLAEKRIKFAEAKELLKLEDNDQITKAALYAVKRGLSIDQVERLVMQMTGLLDPAPGIPGQERKKSGARWVDPNVRAAQMELERLLGVRVKIRDRKGKGKIVIEYHTVDDYERVVEMLRGRK
jgi:ParB family transcriptional regulator, chromosome partitioning protein